ncbi:response regulator [Roseomonas sp. CCTCC AB2023176]|uniref:response regulator n=1 Tax=Roseomonas sp. CCTCC AB2023176 TaxID=3342640 RepID=UPI0035E1CFBB
MLTGRGHQVQRLAAAGGALAVLAEGARPDVVLTDLVMPGGRSGLDLALEIRARHPGQPVLLMTGFAEREEEALAAGLPLLRKPVEEAELIAALAAVAPARAEAV